MDPQSLLVATFYISEQRERNVKMTLKDEAELVHAMLNYHAQKGQLAFK